MDISDLSVNWASLELNNNPDHACQIPLLILIYLIIFKSYLQLKIFKASNISPLSAAVSLSSHLFIFYLILNSVQTKWHFIERTNTNIYV